MEHNTLSDEYSKKTAELLAKQVEVENLNKKLFEIMFIWKICRHNKIQVFGLFLT